MNNEMIMQKAQKLASQELTLSELFKVTHEELMGTASLGMLLAAHGNFNEAHIIMEGLLALAPRNGLLFTVYAEVCQLEGDRDRAVTLLKASEELKMGPTERVRRSELAMWGRDTALSKRELERRGEAPLKGELGLRVEKLRHRLKEVAH